VSKIRAVYPPVPPPALPPTDPPSKSHLPAPPHAPPASPSNGDGDYSGFVMIAVVTSIAMALLLGGGVVLSVGYTVACLPSRRGYTMTGNGYPSNGPPPLLFRI
jgi:hypothetical protein